MDIAEFENKYNEILAEHKYLLKEVGNSYLVYKKTIKGTNVIDPEPDYVLTIFFNNEKIKDIKLIKYKYWLDDYTPRKSKQTYHFKSMDDLLKELYEYKI